MSTAVVITKDVFHQYYVNVVFNACRKVKHSQIVSGVKGLNFWLSTFSWDFINYMIPSLLVICLFAIADVKNLAGKFA